MIFNVPGHIDMIQNGLSYIKPSDILYHPMPERIVKTQTRRINRSYYQVEAERKKPHEIGYAVQRKRGAKGEPDIRIVMDRIWEEKVREIAIGLRGHKYLHIAEISKEDAWAEGGYTPEQYETVFLELNPKWDGWSRWAYKFHVIKVRKNVPGISSHAREERVIRTFQFPPMQTEGGYPRI